MILMNKMKDVHHSYFNDAVEDDENNNENEHDKN